jgi:hypothetical protein
LAAAQWSADVNGVTSHITIRNIGAKTSASTIVRVIYDEEILGESAVGSIVPGDSTDAVILLSQSMTYGRIEITVNPDSGGSDEVTLLNNTAVVVLSPPGDFGRDGSVDIEDLAALLSQWLWEGEPGAIEEDLMSDGRVDFKDFDVLAENWMQ